jgi:glycosyltransferase involved in cell wall biosynthesis
MRVCSPQLGLSPEATLGGEVYDREILTRLADLGIQIEVILPAGLPCAQAANLRVTRVPLVRGYRWFVSNWIFPWYIRQVYSRRPFDLLRVHSLRFTGLAALVSRRLFHLPVPVVVHHHHLDRDRWTDSLERWVVQRCDLVITGSQFSQRQLTAELRLSAERIQVIDYGVSRSYRPLPRDETLAQRLGLGNQKVLLYLGSLKERKNLPVLLQALRLVREVRRDVYLLMVGRGETQQALRKQASELGLENSVHFAGFVAEGDKTAWYNLADVFVLPSLLEGFGLAAAEAMACGKPVVASRAGSLPEVVVDGETGILCDSDDPSEFAYAIKRLLDDPSLAETMGRAGRERVEQLFRWESSALRTLQVYEKAVHSWQA